MTRSAAKPCGRAFAWVPLMYLTPEMLRRLEEEFGVPVRAQAETPFAGREFALLERCLRKERAHDVTLFIRGEAGRDGEERFAVIRKPGYPPGVFRPPSGGIEPGEPFAAGAAREAWEETGLRIRLERYLLRIEARFTLDGACADWTTYVFSASTADASPFPQDRKEIEEARWATPREMIDCFRPRMLAMGSAGMRYRVELQDAALRLLGYPVPEDTGSGILRLER